jgi:hypothetical protein
MRLRWSPAVILSRRSTQCTRCAANLQTYVSRRCTYPPTRLGDSASQHLDVQALAVHGRPSLRQKNAHALHLCVRGVPDHLSPEFSLPVRTCGVAMCMLDRLHEVSTVGWWALDVLPGEPRPFQVSSQIMKPWVVDARLAAGPSVSGHMSWVCSTGSESDVRTQAWSPPSRAAASDHSPWICRLWRISAYKL